MTSMRKCSPRRLKKTFPQSNRFWRRLSRPSPELTCTYRALSFEVSGTRGPMTSGCNHETWYQIPRSRWMLPTVHVPQHDRMPKLQSICRTIPQIPCHGGNFAQGTFTIPDLPYISPCLAHIASFQSKVPSPHPVGIRTNSQPS
jgi:hypothetical protein